MKGVRGGIILTLHRPLHLPRDQKKMKSRKQLRPFRLTTESKQVASRRCLQAGWLGRPIPRRPPLCQGRSWQSGSVSTTFLSVQRSGGPGWLVTHCGKRHRAELILVEREGERGEEAPTVPLSSRRGSLLGAATLLGRGQL